MIWTQEQVANAFDNDVDRFERPVNDAVQIELTQNQLDALVSFPANEPPNTGGSFSVGLTNR